MRIVTTLSYVAALTVAAVACDQAGTVVQACPCPEVDAGATAASDAGTDSPSTADASDASPVDSADAGIESRVAALLAQMTLDEKVGQMTMAGYGSLPSLDDITTYALGGLGGAPEGLTAQDWFTITTNIRAKVAATRLKIPIVIAIDSIHGNAKVRGATVFPQNIGLGSTGDADLVRRVEAATASEVLALGITTTWGPDVDVSRDERWGRTYETFAEEPDVVSTMARAGVAGYQGAGLGTPGALMACPKHALGSGGTAWGTAADGELDRGDVQVDEAEMRRVHLPPFQAAIEAGAQALMVSYCSFHGTKMSASSYWLESVIKGELGFDGMLVSDGGAIYLLGGSTLDDARMGIEGGLDMFIVGGTYAQFFTDAKSLVTSGTIPMSRIDESVRRILRVKMRAGLFEAPAPDFAGLSVVGSAAHRTLAREAVQKSLVLLENEGAILPIPKTARIHVAGKGANDIGIQSGGWTLYWGGVTGIDPATFGGGTTILGALQKAVTSPGVVTYSEDGTGAAGADVGIVVLHELPYSEGEGDVPDPRFDSTANPHVYDGTAATVLANMTAANIPLVLVTVTGRPVRIESLLPQFRAVVAAWLPGSEGDGVADVLFGDVKFTGKLTHSWPKDATVLPFVYDKVPYDPLYAYGFGLSD